MPQRSREKILGNLETIFREAYERAKASGDPARMQDLDASFQREQLLLEVLLDIREALKPADSSTAKKALNKIKALRDIAKLK
ncbi:MAG: hypothetical protein ACE5FJ_04380 [Gemmatimonadales bacterium]